jgi:hypothetical protein
MVHGLWVTPNAVTQDFLTVMYRIRALGFNAVRLPMSFQARALAARRACLRRSCQGTPVRKRATVCMAGRAAARPQDSAMPHPAHLGLSAL